jgi:hypothetical protein
MEESRHLRLRLTLRVALGAAMVVMALGLLLSVIPFPSESDRRTVCHDNLLQIGSALQEYATGWDDKYPWRLGASKPGDAWRDLCLLHPLYIDDLLVFLCPSSRDRLPAAPKPSEPAADNEAEPLAGGPGLTPTSSLGPEGTPWVTSYGLCHDSRGEAATSWSAETPDTLLLVADKKAGIEIKDDLVELAAHKDEGRNVLYQDGFVKWVPGGGALDPDEDDDKIGKPNADDYTKWWSDPPWYGEGMADDEGPEESED